MVTAVVFILTFPFLSKVAPKKKKKVDSAGLFFCVVLSPERYKECCVVFFIIYLFIFLFFSRKRACAMDPGETCACFQTPSPLGRSHRHTPDPSASNVNNPAFPGRGGRGQRQSAQASCQIPRDSKRGSPANTPSRAPRSCGRTVRRVSLETWPPKKAAKRNILNQGFIYFQSLYLIQPGDIMQESSLSE